MSAYSKTCYLAGPMDGLSEEDYTSWRRKLTVLLNELDIAVLDPTRNVPGKVSGEIDVVAVDKDDLDNSDFVIAFCPFPSVGTSMEIFRTYEVQNKPVLVVSQQEELSPWITAHCDEVFDTFDELIAFVRGWRRGGYSVGDEGVRDVRSIIL